MSQLTQQFQPEPLTKINASKQTYYNLKHLPQEANSFLSQSGTNSKSYHPEIKNLQLVFGNNNNQPQKNSHVFADNDWETSGFLSPALKFEKKARLVRLEEELTAKDRQIQEILESIEMKNSLLEEAEAEIQQLNADLITQREKQEENEKKGKQQKEQQQVIQELQTKMNQMVAQNLEKMQTIQEQKKVITESQLNEKEILKQKNALLQQIQAQENASSSDQLEDLLNKICVIGNTFNDQHNTLQQFDQISMQLTDQIQSLKKSNEAHENEKNELKSSIRALEMELENKKFTIYQSSLQEQNVNKIQEQFEVQLKIKNNEIISIKQEINKKQQEINNSEAQLQKQFQIKEQGFQKQINQFKENEMHLQNQLNSLKLALKQNDLEKQQFTQTLKTVETKALQLEQKNNQKKLKLTSYKNTSGDIQQCQQQITDLKQVIEKNKNEFNDLTEINNQKQQIILTLEKDLEQTRSQYQEKERIFEQELVKFKEQLEKQATNEKQLHKQLEAQTETFNVFKATQAAFQETIDKLEKEKTEILNSSDQLIQSLKQELFEKCGQIQQISDSLDYHENSKNEFKIQNSDLAERVKELQQDLIDKNEQNEQTSKLYETKITKFEDMQEKINQELDKQHALLQHYQNQIAQNNQEKIQLTQRIEEVNKNFLAQTNLIEQLEQQSQHQEWVHDNALKEAQETIKQLNDTKVKLKQKNQLLKMSVSKSNQQISKQKTLEVAIEKTRGENENKFQRIKEMEGQIATIQNENKMLQESQQTFTQQLATNNEEKQLFEKQLKEANKKIIGLESQIQQKNLSQQQLEQFRCQYADLQQENQSFQIEIERLQKELNANMLESQKVNQQNYLEIIEEFQNQIHKLTEDSTNQQNTIQELQKQLQQAHEQIHQNQFQNEITQQQEIELERSKEQITILTNQLNEENNNQQTILSLQEKLAKTDEQITALKKKNQILVTQYDEHLLQKNNEEHSNYEKKFNELNEKFIILQDQLELEQKANYVSQFFAQIQSKQMKENELQLTKQQQQQESLLLKLQSQLKTKQNEIKQLYKILDDRKQQINEIQNKNKTLQESMLSEKMKNSSFMQKSFRQSEQNSKDQIEPYQQQSKQILNLIEENEEERDFPMHANSVLPQQVKNQMPSMPLHINNIYSQSMRNSLMPLEITPISPHAQTQLFTDLQYKSKGN